MHGMAKNGVMGKAGGPMGMIEIGQPGSGKQFMEMHHEMIRVFRFLLEHHQPPLHLQAEWRKHFWYRSSNNGYGYAPQLWDLDHPEGLPHEVVAMFALTDPHYLELAFAGVHHLVDAQGGKLADAVDNLGQFIETGVPSGKQPDGSGFHDTIHEYLAAREGKSARGAEMSNLANARFNEYFWGMHLWIDGQYGRLLEKRGEKFDVSPLDPQTLNMCTDEAAGKMHHMEMAAS